MLLVIDDIQWASSATVLLLRHLVAVAPDLRLCLMLTARSQPGSRHADMDPLSALTTVPNASVLQLGGLSIGDIAAHPDLTPEIDPNAAAETLMRQTGGNPLLLTTVLHTRDDPGGDDRTQPLILEAAIEAHLERFGPDERNVLGLAAAAGPDVDPMLVRMAGPKIGLSPSVVNQALDSAERAGAVDLADTGWYVFRHDLLRECLLGSIAGSRRAEFHAALADAIEMRGDAAGPVLFELADHLHQARSIVRPVRIEEVMTRAARAAAADLDFDAAGRHYERAAAASTRAGSGHEATLLLESALCRRCAGDTDQALTLIDSAITAAAGHPDVLGRAVVARGRHELMVTGTIAGATAVMAGSLVGQNSVTDAGREAELWYLRVIGDHPGHLAEAIAGIDDPEIVFDAGVQAFRNAGPEDRVGVASLLGDVAAELGDVRSRVHALLASWLVDIEQGAGHIDDPVVGELDRLVDSDDSEVLLRWMRDTWAGARDLAAGRVARARRSIDAAYARARGATLPMGHLPRIHFTYRGQVDTFSLLAGQAPDYDMMAQPIHRFATADPVIWEVSVTTGMLWSGMRDEAVTRFTRVCDEALDPGRITTDRLYSLCLLAWGNEALADAALAARIRDALMPYRGHAAVAGHSLLAGSVDHWLAIAYRTLGDLDLAVETVSAARDQARRQGMHSWRAVSTIGLVAALIDRDEAGDRAEAIGLADDVGRWAADIGLQAIAAVLREQTAPLRR